MFPFTFEFGDGFSFWSENQYEVLMSAISMGKNIKKKIRFEEEQG